MSTAVLTYLEEFVRNTALMRIWRAIITKTSSSLCKQSTRQKKRRISYEKELCWNQTSTTSQAQSRSIVDIPNTSSSVCPAKLFVSDVTTRCPLDTPTLSYNSKFLFLNRRKEGLTTNSISPMLSQVMGSPVFPKGWSLVFAQEKITLQK